MRLPDLHEISIVLAQSLFDRYDTTLLDDDYEEEMAVAEKVIAFRDPGDGPSPQREAAVELAIMFADKKFHVHGKPEHLDQAIYRFRAFLDGISLGDPDRP